jgi:hypothetical protein
MEQKNAVVFGNSVLRVVDPSIFFLIVLEVHLYVGGNQTFLLATTLHLTHNGYVYVPFFCRDL